MSQFYLHILRVIRYALYLPAECTCIVAYSLKKSHSSNLPKFSSGNRWKIWINPGDVDKYACQAL